MPRPRLVVTTAALTLAISLAAARPLAAAPAAEPALGKVLIVQLRAETVVLEGAQVKRLEDRTFVVGKIVPEKRSQGGAPRVWLALSEVVRLTSFDSLAQLEVFQKAGRPAVHEKVEVEEHGTWWPAEIVEIKGGRYHIHYTGWDSSYDKWVGLEQIRRPGEVKKTACPQPDDSSP